MGFGANFGVEEAWIGSPEEKLEREEDCDYMLSDGHKLDGHLAKRKARLRPRAWMIMIRLWKSLDRTILRTPRCISRA